MGKIYSPEERQKLLDKVEELKKQGLPAYQALRKVKLSYGTYHDWKKSRKKVKEKRTYNKATPQLITLPLQDETPTVTVLIGKSSEINGMLDKIIQIQKGQSS